MQKAIYSDEYKAVINKLKQARIKSGLSQTQAAKKLGKLQSFVSKIELCERRLDVAELILFAKLYKKPIKFFFNEY